MTRANRRDFAKLKCPPRFDLSKRGAAPSPSPILTPAIVRDIIRKELRAAQDRKSFAAAGGWMNLGQTVEYTGISRNALFEMRQRRRRAKSQAEKDAHCWAEYGDTGRPRFKRSEVE